jgi:energy-coupling factor transporter ATP-binding protein EcfA2
MLRAGEWVVLLGATGSGKSTLCGILLNLIPAMTGGTLTGSVTLAPGHTLGYVFQDAEAQLFNMTVEDEIAFGLETSGLTRSEMQARVRQWLGWARLDGMGARAPWQLSGGQKKRLALASVLAMSPSVLVLDEPTAGLDPQGVAEVCESLNDLRQRGQHTLFIATSDVELGTRYADRALVLADGRIAQEGPLDRLWMRPDSPASKVGVPQIVALGRELQRRGQPASFVTLEEAVEVLTVDGGRWTADEEDKGRVGDIRGAKRILGEIRGNKAQNSSPISNLQPPLSRLPSAVIHPPSPVIVVEHLTFQYPEAALAAVDLEYV